MTAVEWFADKVDNLIPFISDNTSKKFCELVEQAKEMEKQQKIDFAEAFYDSLFQDAESYHNYLESKK